jgi:digeranylgeranylglycerophospholipid reductase
LKRNEYDVVVVGAGPAGSVTARHIALEGYSVLMIEKRPIIGSPVRCGEATGKRSRLADFGPVNEDTIETDINGLIIHAADGISIKHDQNEVGLMLDRLKFDPHMADLAEKAGVEVITGARATDIKKPYNGKRIITIDLENEVFEISAKMIVGADGAEALTGRWTGLKTRQLPPYTCSAIELKLDKVDPNPNHLTFWVGNDYILDGYIWSFPKIKSGTTNFGAGFLTPKLKAPNIKEVTEEWLEKLMPGYNVTGVMGGAVPVSGMLEEYVADHFLLVGDAAHHTNPLTGGGIASGMAGALVASEWILKALKEGDFSRTFFKQYEVGCWNQFGKNHHVESNIRNYIIHMGRDEEIQFYRFLKEFLDEGKFKTLLKHPMLAFGYYRKFKSFKNVTQPGL